MSHNVLLKHGWEVVFTSNRLTVYELDGYQYYKWSSGKDMILCVN